MPFHFVRCPGKNYSGKSAESDVCLVLSASTAPPHCPASPPSPIQLPPLLGPLLLSEPMSYSRAIDM